ncbi:helix-turn-helix transcriptional regulator [candidate division WOR-3 bacterium]|nr:helix-turn-helix transcriptional regulator [candidate division WOR-3 bacterium]
MEPKILKEIFYGFIKVHILYHTDKRAFFGQELKEELQSHGYQISFGTLYPMLSKLKAQGYLSRREVKVKGKIRKYYSITEKGKAIFEVARLKLKELSTEVFNEDEEKT